ncbi:hypothetical protein Agub_g11447, partial [Astrephomene gubernaculifera]
LMPNHNVSAVTYGASSRRVAAAAVRAPKHAYGGPEPFGTGGGISQWEREATALLRNHLRVEREKEWKRVRHQLIRRGTTPLDEQHLGPERAAEIEQTRLRVRFAKFWGLMHEKDRSWQYDVVVHLCTALSPYSCKRYSSVTAATMQGILAKREKAERAVHEQRAAAGQLRRRMTAAARQMQYSGRPLPAE